MKKTGVELIAAERERQIKEEGWTPKHDTQHTNGELAKAAVCYALPDRLPEVIPLVWPWSDELFKATPDDRIRELSKDGALIDAEIDRLQAL